MIYSIDNMLMHASVNSVNNQYLALTLRSTTASYPVLVVFMVYSVIPDFSFCNVSLGILFMLAISVAE